jgi:hypothetical protein
MNVPPSKIDVVKGTKVMMVGIGNQPHACKREEKRDAGEEKAALGAVRDTLNKDRIYARVPQSKKQSPSDDHYQQTDEDGCIKEHRFLPASYYGA